VPEVRSDHGALKTIMLGVWRVAASSLMRGRACEHRSSGKWTCRFWITVPQRKKGAGGVAARAFRL